MIRNKESYGSAKGDELRLWIQSYSNIQKNLGLTTVEGKRIS